MSTGAENTAKDYSDITVEVSSFYKRLLYARHCGDFDAAAEAERKMNADLEELGDVIKILGRTAL